VTDCVKMSSQCSSIATSIGDWLGLSQVVELCDRYAHLGNHYIIPDELRAKAARGARYYQA